MHYVLALLAACLIPATAVAQHPGWTFEFVGFSSGTVDGGAGVQGMTDECNETFGAARMCTTEEIARSVFDLGLLSSDRAWVRPEPEYVGIASQGHLFDRGIFRQSRSK